MQHLESQGVELQMVLDIGSFHGQFGDMINVVWPNAKVISIEANPQHKKINPRQITACLSNHTNMVDFYIPNPDVIATGASYYKENTIYYTHATSIPMKTTTLDNLYQQYQWQGNWHQHGMIKLDTQGSELDILEGAAVFLQQHKPKFILLEVSHLNYNLGAPGASQVMCYLYQRGYHWKDTWHQLYVQKSLVQSDILMVRAS